VRASKTTRTRSSQSERRRCLPAMRTSSACPRGVVSAATGSAIRHVLQIAPATLELSA
jgi:hypothetical protein